jgi:hypothetical protein
MISPFAGCLAGLSEPGTISFCILARIFDLLQPQFNLASEHHTWMWLCAIG